MNAIDHDEMKHIIDHDEDVLVIDTLPTDDYEQGHIPGSISIPFAEPVDTFVANVERQALDKQHPIVVYCASSECPVSRKAAEALRAAGFTDVTAYEGGMKEWTEKGHHIVTGLAAL